MTLWMHKTARSGRRIAVRLVLLVSMAVVGAPSVFAQSATIQQIVVSGVGTTAVTTSATCNNTLYVSCYTMTLGTIDAFGISTTTGYTAYNTPNATSPTATVYAGTIQFRFQVGPSPNNGQTGATFIRQVANFTQTYLSGQYCQSGCTSAASFVTIPTTNTSLGASIVENTNTPLSIGVRMAVGNGAGFAAASNPAYQFVIRVTAVQGNNGQTRVGESLITVNITQAASVIRNTVSWTSNYGTTQGLPFSSTQPIATNPYPGSIYYGQYQVTPTFSQFSSTTGTLKAYILTNFSPALAANSVTLCDASTNTQAATCTPIGTTSPGTTVSSTVTSGSTVTRYLGLVVKEGGPAFPGGPGTTSGATNATVRFTMTVP